MNPDAIAQIYASDIVSGFDIHKPEKLNVLFSRYGDQGASYFQIVRSMGFEKQVSLDTYGHYEENRIHEVCVVNANVPQPAVGQDIQFALSDKSLDANGNYYVRRFDVLMFPNEVTGSVMAISDAANPVLTVRLSDPVDQFPALTQDDEIIIITNAFSEGSGQPRGAVRGTWEYVNDAQIIKETMGVTGSEMVNQTWFNVTSRNQKIPAYYFLGQIDIDYRMALRIDGALLWSRRILNPNSIDPDTGRPLKATEGMIPYTRRVGNEMTYVPGAFSVDEFDTMDRILDREHAGNYTLALLGIQLSQDVENALVTYFADTNINYARQTVNEALFKSNESLGASVNFKYLTKSERTFLFKRMGVLSNPKLYGAEGYGGPQLGVFLPINKRKDPVSGNMVESIGVRYRGLGRYNRRMEVWQVGGAGEGLKVTDIDERNTYQRCHIGAHFRGGNQFVLMEP